MKRVHKELGILVVVFFIFFVVVTRHFYGVLHPHRRQPGPTAVVARVPAKRAEPPRAAPWDHVFVVNLDAQPQRWATVRWRLERAGVHRPERWPALHPLSPEVKALWDRYKVRNTTDYDRAMHRKRALSKASELAILLTYQQVIRAARERSYRRIVIFEDDVIPSRTFAQDVQRIHELPPDTKLVLLGASQWSWADGKAFKYAGYPHVNFYHPLYTDGAFATVIDSSLYDLLEWEIEKHANVLDSGPMRAVYRRFQSQCYVFNPNIVIADVRDSNIRAGQNMEKRARKMHWPLEQFDIDLPPGEPDERDTNPLVSVVMTCKNCEATLEYAVDSILGQTHQNLEVLLVDDGSDTPAPGEVMRRLMQRDGRVRIKILARSVGTYNARNIALKMAKGTIYANHDCDDVAVPYRLENQLRPILDNRVDATVAYHIRTHVPVSTFVKSQTRGLSWLRTEIDKLRVHRNHYGDYQYCCREKLGLMTFVCRMSLFEELGPFADTSFSGDAEFVERLLYARKGIGMSRAGTDYNWHRFLEVLHPRIPGVIEVLPETLVLAYGGNTMSKKVAVGGRERQKFEERYRLAMIHRFNNASNVLYY